MNESAIAAEEAKSCCAVAYENDWARLLLGDSFHPGGIDLTLRLGRALGLRPGMHVLDVACARGTSALALAGEFGCFVHGVDLGERSIAEARVAAQSAGLDHLVTFEVGDAEGLPVPAASFDCLICECAFCTFPSKGAAALEFRRALRPGGRLGLTDITRTGVLPAELQTLLGWVACLADARPVDEYIGFLSSVGFTDFRQEGHNSALASLASKIKFKLIGVEVLARVGKAPVPLDEVLQAKRITKVAAESIRTGTLGYALLVARRGEGE
ncbi:MAG: class I SAM-dependent methyltransferase [Dehalococcoidia bacterium]